MQLGKLRLGAQIQACIHDIECNPPEDEILETMGE